jgi:hypothetical protein
MRNLLIAFLLISLIYPASGQSIKNETYYDSVISGLVLRNPESITTTFKNPDLDLNYYVDDTIAVSKDGLQVIELMFHPGGTTNEVYEFRINYNTTGKTSPLILKDNQLITGKGIQLGLTKKEVKKQLGKPTSKETKNGEAIWKYKRNLDMEDLYFGKYTFKKDKLVEFWFGDAYP